MDYLTKRAYTILGRNIRTPYGEIDIIALSEGVTIFVEVKTRSTRSFGFPEEGLTRRKISHMLACARHYAAENEIETWQCDAIAIEGKPGSLPMIEYFENIAND